MLNFSWGRGLRNIVEPLNAVVLAVILEKQPNFRRSVGESYTCDRCPSKGAATGENAGVVR